MKLFFWQNINSIHQSEFFRALSSQEDFDTTLIVTEKVKAERVEMGWGNPQISGLKIIDISNNNSKWQSIIFNNKDSNSLHLFSGISAFPKVYQALNYAVQNECRIAIFTEPFDFRGFKGFIRLMRGYYYKLKFDKKIEFILVTGNIGAKQFEKFGFSKNKVFEWAYSVEKSQNIILEKPNEVYKIIFAGSLIKRKGYDYLFAAFHQLQKNNIRFKANLYCLKKNERNKAEEILNSFGLSKNINLYPFLPNIEIRKKISQHDLLVLPSRHDGWGAVVNESLAEGTPVIVSDRCGSSILINSLNGKVMKAFSQNHLYSLLHDAIIKGSISTEHRKEIQLNYHQIASGPVLVKYFRKILNYTDISKIDDEVKPISPWQSN